MERNTQMTARERVKQFIKAFPEIYPGAHCELDFKNPLQLLIATILSGTPDIAKKLERHLQEK